MIKVTAEKQHSLEQRTQRASALDTAFQNSERMPNFLSEELRTRYLDSLTIDELVAWIKEVNGILTTDDLQPSSFADNVGHVLESDGTEDSPVQFQLLPAPEDKQELLEYVLSSAQFVDDIETKAMILGFGISAVHPFKDGNGRTSRVVHALFTHDYEPGSPLLKEAVINRLNTEVVLSPSIFTGNINQLLSEQMHSMVKTGGASVAKVLPTVSNVAFNDLEEYATPRRETTYDEMRDMINIFADKTVGPIVAHLLELHTTYRSVRTAIKENGQNRKKLFVDSFLTNASQEEVDVAYRFYREATSTRAKLLIDVLAGRQYTDVGVVGRSKLGEIYSFQEFGRRAANGAMLRGVDLESSQQ